MAFLRSLLVAALACAVAADNRNLRAVFRNGQHQPGVQSWFASEMCSLVLTNVFKGGKESGVAELTAGFASGKIQQRLQCELALKQQRLDDSQLDDEFNWKKDKLSQQQHDGPGDKLTRGIVRQKEVNKGANYRDIVGAELPFEKAFLSHTKLDPKQITEKDIQASILAFADKLKQGVQKITELIHAVPKQNTKSDFQDFISECVVFAGSRFKTSRETEQELLESATEISNEALTKVQKKLKDMKATGKAKEEQEQIREIIADTVCKAMVKIGTTKKAEAQAFEEAKQKEKATVGGYDLKGMKHMQAATVKQRRKYECKEAEQQTKDKKEKMREYQTSGSMFYQLIDIEGEPTNKFGPIVTYCCVDGVWK